MGSLTIGFNGENYIFPCRKFKIHGSHLKPGKYVQKIAILRKRKTRSPCKIKNKSKKTSQIDRKNGKIIN